MNQTTYLTDVRMGKIFQKNVILHIPLFCIKEVPEDNVRTRKDYWC